MSRHTTVILASSFEREAMASAWKPVSMAMMVRPVTQSPTSAQVTNLLAHSSSAWSTLLPLNKDRSA